MAPPSSLPALPYAQCLQCLLFTPEFQRATSARSNSLKHADMAVSEKQIQKKLKHVRIDSVSLKGHARYVSERMCNETSKLSKIHGDVDFPPLPIRTRLGTARASFSRALARASLRRAMTVATSVSA
eukprot:scaffold2514_cov205-Pinguiococcus_pyrenoidosus.AAC.3